MARVTPLVSRSLDEFLIISGRQQEGITPDRVDLGIAIGQDRYPLSWFAAAMQSVSGDQLGIALAQYGGTAVLPRSLAIDDQVAMVHAIKREKAGFNYHVRTVSPELPLGQLMAIQEGTGYSIFPVVDGGRLVGLITEKKYHPGKDHGKTVAERMIPRDKVITAPQDTPLREANEIVLTNGLGILPIVDQEDRYLASVFWSDIRKHVAFPNEAVDKESRYRCAGAVSTFLRDDIPRAEALVAAGVDLLVIDTSDLKSDFGERMIRELKERFSHIPVMAGNVIDDVGYRVAAAAGADAVKVGQGPGHGCTTREVKRTGRGQATAIMQVAAARDALAKELAEAGIAGRKAPPVIADGGIAHTGHMNVAYACGADGLMMGNYFGQFTESAGPLERHEVEVTIEGRTMMTPVLLKRYWGEASPRAQNRQRYGYTRGITFVPEGREGLIPHRGSIHDSEHGMPVDMAFVQKTVAESGALTPREFAERATLELQSEGAAREGRSKV